MMHQNNPYQIIVRPMITEKALAGGEKKREYTFRVAIDANKREIKWAVEAAYGVKVQSVNTVVVKGKVRHARMRGARPGKRADVKKAIVKLAEGQQIALM